MSISAFSIGDQKCQAEIALLHQCFFLNNRNKITCSSEFIVEVNNGSLKFLDIYYPYHTYNLRNRTPTLLHKNNMYINYNHKYKILSRYNDNSGEVVLRGIKTDVQELNIEPMPVYLKEESLKNILEPYSYSGVKINFINEICSGERKAVRIEFDCEYSIIEPIDKDNVKYTMNFLYYLPRDAYILNLDDAIHVKRLVIWLVFPEGLKPDGNMAPCHDYKRKMPKFGLKLMEPLFHPRTKEIWMNLPRTIGGWGEKNEIALKPGESESFCCEYTVAESEPESSSFSKKTISESMDSKLQTILTEHKKWLDSDGKVGIQADLQEANLSKANLEGVDLRKANLKRADLSYSNLLMSDLKEASLIQANIRGGNLGNTILDGAILDGAILAGADLGGSILKNASLKKVNLRGANVERVNLSGANLEGADLERADLKNSDLRLSNFCRSNLAHVDFNDAVFDATNLKEIRIDEQTIDKIPLDIRGKFEKSWTIVNVHGEPIENRKILHSYKIKPEYHYAFMKILDCFGEIAREKFQNSINTFKTGHEGLIVSMIIELENAKDKNLIENSFDDYKLVLRGIKTPQEFTDKKHQENKIIQLLQETSEKVSRLDNRFEIQNNALLPFFDMVFRGDDVISGKTGGQIDPLLYFTTDYNVMIKRGPDQNGILIINGKTIPIGHLEADLCIIMANQLKNEYSCIDNMDVGWVSYKKFRNSVPKWKKADNGISNESIIKAINRLNLKIREGLNLTEDHEDLIINGKDFGWKKHYRFRVFPKLLIIE